jgi:hypothetical protein
MCCILTIVYVRVASAQAQTMDFGVKRARTSLRKDLQRRLIDAVPEAIMEDLSVATVLDPR